MEYSVVKRQDWMDVEDRLLGGLQKKLAELDQAGADALVRECRDQVDLSSTRSRWHIAAKKLGFRIRTSAKNESGRIMLYAWRLS